MERDRITALSYFLRFLAGNPDGDAAARAMILGAPSLVFPAPTRIAPRTRMDTPTLEKIVVAALEDVKARDIEVIDTSRHTPLFDRIVVASAESSRQTRALAQNVHDKVKEAGGEVIGTEGQETGEWVLVDLGNIVVHVMQPAVRAHYKLEELWNTSPSSRRAATRP